MAELRFTEEHEWVRIEADGSLTIGISDYAQAQLGDVVYVELPGIGQVVKPGDELVVLESVKAAGEIKAPFGGEVVETNEDLQARPDLINSDPAGAGWIVRLRPVGALQLDALMDDATYRKWLAGL